MKEELIKYVMEQADKCYSDDFPINCIENWIREFFDQYQPERSKREDQFLSLKDRFIKNHPNFEFVLNKKLNDFKSAIEELDAVL